MPEGAGSASAAVGNGGSGKDEGVAEGFPYAGTYVGADAIIAGVFQRLGTEWIGYRADVHTFLEDGDRVAAFGFDSGTYKATGKSMRAAFAHLYALRDGKILRMTQHVDTVMVQRALDLTSQTAG